MKSTINKWGNSMALRIPKPIVKEYMFKEGCSVEIISKDGKIILEPEKTKVREGWEMAAKEAHKNNDDENMMDYSNDFDDKEWTW